MSLYRACCCQQGSCCNIWCSCAERITISFCKVVHQADMYSCLEAEGYCYPPVGDLIGSSLRTIVVKDVVFEKKTGFDPETGCPNCCWYEPVTGEEQTGTVRYTRDEWYIWCAEPDGEDCVFGNRTCVGAATRPLSGSATNWNLTNFSGKLFLDCCDPTKCDSGSIKAKLNFAVEGVSIAGTFEDCCTQTSSPLSTTISFGVSYEWDCRDRSRWTGTCPCDLLQENGTGNIVGNVSSCFAGLNGNCPCPTTGPGFDYSNPCIVNQSASIFYCIEASESLECIPTGNGVITAITGCV